MSPPLEIAVGPAAVAAMTEGDGEGYDARRHQEGQEGKSMLCRLKVQRSTLGSPANVGEGVWYVGVAVSCGCLQGEHREGVPNAV